MGRNAKESRFEGSAIANGKIVESMTARPHSKRYEERLPMLGGSCKKEGATQEAKQTSIGVGGGHFTFVP
jgi:hypothetical protein